MQPFLSCVGLDLADVHYEIAPECHLCRPYADIRKGRLVRGESTTAVIIQKIHDPVQAMRDYFRQPESRCSNFYDFVDRIEDATGTIGRAMVFKEPLHFLSTTVPTGGFPSLDISQRFMGHLLNAITHVHYEMNQVHGHITPNVIFLEPPQQSTDINLASWTLKLGFDIDAVLDFSWPVLSTRGP
ncbi:hypothetical protein C8J56DRAFT_63746 [Mycena floridula]|nr:hypothetical protein C8J56DRAFT_63746 [Mycena floridula]